MNYIIQTQRLILRPFLVSDSTKYFAITQDPEIKNYVPYACCSSFEETESVIENIYSKCDFSHDFYLIIEDKSSSKIIGALIVTEDFSQEYYEGCYFIANHCRNNGYMREALLAFLGSIVLSDKPIMFRIKSDNTPSLNLVRKIQGIEELSQNGWLTRNELIFCYNCNTK